MPGVLTRALGGSDAPLALLVRYYWVSDTWGTWYPDVLLSLCSQRGSGMGVGWRVLVQPFPLWAQLAPQNNTGTYTRLTLGTPGVPG